MNILNLKVARVKKGLTQKELGELVGVSSNTLCRIETGKQIPKVDMLLKLAEILEVSAEELL
jgi:transcriptional regulator with XRE-family HTH domain